MALLLNASPQAPHGGGESDGSAPCCGMSGCPSLWPWPRSCTTAHSARRWPGPGGGNELLFTAKFRNIPPPQAAGARYFAMDAGEDVGEAPAAGRPAPLLEVLPQERVQRRTAEQIVDPVLVVPMLHVFVPQKVEQLVDILAPLDFRIAEQVIDVPKIVCPPRAARTVLRAMQTADQLVEVPTTTSYSSLLQRTMEQNVAIPVRGRRGRNADLQGFLRGQGPTAQSSSLERISEQIVEQIADIPVARGDPHGFRPGQSSSSVAHSPAAWLNTEDEPFQGGFRTFSPVSLSKHACFCSFFCCALMLQKTQAKEGCARAMTGKGLDREIFVLSGGKGKGEGCTNFGIQNLQAKEVVGAAKPCPYSDVRLKDSKTLLNDHMSSAAKITLGAPVANEPVMSVGLGDVGSIRSSMQVTGCKIITHDDEGVDTESFSLEGSGTHKAFASPTVYSVTSRFAAPFSIEYTAPLANIGFLPRSTSPSRSNKISRAISLDELVPPAVAATEGPSDSGESVCPSLWARWRPGIASSIFKEMLEEQKGVQKEKEKEKELEKEMLSCGSQDQDDLWETVVLESFGEKKEQGFEEKRVKEDVEKGMENGEKKVKEPEKGTGKVKAKVRKVRGGLLSPTEAVRARAEELSRGVRALLFPGRLKRKHVAYVHGYGINTVSHANARPMERKKHEDKGKLRVEEKNQKVVEVTMKGAVPVVFFGDEKGEQQKLLEEKKGEDNELGSELFVFGEKEKGKMMEEEKELKREEEDKKGCELFVFGGHVREPMSYYKKAEVEEGSEVLFLRRPVVQVREENISPEPGKICFLHRLQGGLQVASVLGGQSLEDWARQLLGERVWEGMGGYFTTKGGKVLNSETPVNKLGLHGSQEVVLQGRLRGGGYSGGGKGVRGGGGNSVAAGDWTCGICNQSGCWNAKNTCYRCGAPRQQSQGLSGQASSGVWDMEGRYQGGVGTGMGGSRVVGPTGRDQSSIPGGNPTHRKGPQPGGKGRNKVGGDTGAGVGVGFGTGGGVVGGGGGGDNRSAFAWLGGGGGVGNPLPPGMVLSERDQYQFCVEHLKRLLKDGEVEEYENFWSGRLPAKPVPAPVKTPTEAQRAEVFAQLTKKQDGLARRVKDGQGRVEAARAKVLQEEAALVELERELKGVSDQVDAHRAENLRRAEEAKAPRVDEVGSDMDLEAVSSSGGEFGVNQVAGKRRKVVRKNRFQGNKASKEELWQFLNEMSDPDKDWVKRQFLGDVGSGVRCADHTLVGDVVELDKVELNARAPLAPTQEDVAETPCG